MRFEGLRTLPMVVTPGCLMFCLDLQSWYQQIGCSEAVKRLQGGHIWLLKQAVEERIEMGLMDPIEDIPYDGLEFYGRSTVLTFGNKRSVSLFTLLTRQVLRMWRSRGWRVAHLLDDFVFAVTAGLMAEAIAMRDQAAFDLEHYGWLVNYEKSTMTPTTLLRWVGVLLDSVAMRFFVPPEKVLQMEGQIKAFVEDGEMPGLRELAEIAGRLSATGAAIIPARRMLRELFMFIGPSAWEKK